MTANFKEEIAKDMAQSGFNVHDNLKDLSVPELRKICDSDRLPFAMCLLNVTGDMNCGSLIRTACLFGAEKVSVVGRRKFDRRGLVGSNNYINVSMYGGLNDDLSIDVNAFHEAVQGYTPVFVELGGHDLGSFNWQSFLSIRNGNSIVGYRKPMLVLGNENRGIPSNILNTYKEYSDSFVVSIPQKGVLRSMNVSCAGSIVCWDLINSMGW